ncbi:MAG: hypothetical protein ACTSRZ_17460 [Promethearchaeota archaeon]
MDLKQIKYSQSVIKRINSYPRLLNKSEIESNIYFGTKIKDRERRFYVVYKLNKSKSRKRRIKKSVKIIVYFMNYDEIYYVNQIHIEKI